MVDKSIPFWQKISGVYSSPLEISEIMFDLEHEKIVLNHQDSFFDDDIEDFLLLCPPNTI